jgi:hypothetical protein
MGFMMIKGLFRKDSVNDYQDVLVPLANAQRHPTAEAEHASRRPAEGHDGNTASYDKKEDGPLNFSESSGKGVMRTSSANYSPYTIEGLRAECMEDVTASGHDSSYDRKIIFDT